MFLLGPQTFHRSTQTIVPTLSLFLRQFPVNSSHQKVILICLSRFPGSYYILNLCSPFLHLRSEDLESVVGFPKRPYNNCLTLRLESLSCLSDQ